MPQPIKLLVVVPTRNRGRLAAAAARSVIDQLQPGTSLWVSDNSTEPSERDELERFCSQHHDQARYLRPPEPLAMGKHWEWIAQQILADGSISHVSFLTDRMLLRPRGLGIMLKLCERFPQQVIACEHDHIDDFHAPVKLEQVAWTGRLLQIDSARFSAYVLKVGWTQLLPRLVNGVTPCSTLRAVNSFYGNVCDLVSPDVGFGMRMLERAESFIFYDRALLVDYAMARSHGYNVQRGIVNQDAADFAAQLAGGNYASAAPIPGLTVNGNYLYHEYVQVRAGSDHHRLPAINLAQYSRLISRDIRRYKEPQRQALMQQRYDAQLAVWKTSAAYQRDRARLVLHGLLQRFAPGYLYRKLLKLGMSALSSLGLLRLLARILRIPAPCMQGRSTEHPDAGAALQHAFNQPVPLRWGASTAEFRIHAALLGRCTD